MRISTPLLDDFMGEMPMHTQWIVPYIIRCNEHARTAFHALQARGMPESEAENEIARALLGCVWEMYQGLPNRFGSAMDELCYDTSVTDLFPAAYASA
jgi:hypothetical protein